MNPLHRRFVTRLMRKAQSSGPHRRGAPLGEVWWSDRAALLFAIEFAQASADEALRSIAEVFEFVQAPTPTDPKDADVKTVMGIQSETRNLLRELARDGYTGYELNVSGILMMRPERGGSSRRIVRSMMNTDSMSVRDRFLHRVIRLLEGVTATQLQVCQAPQAGSEDPCGRVFLKLTRKEFCSARCQSRAYMRKLRNPETHFKAKGARHGKTTRAR